MGARGRRSSESLAVISSTGIETIRRPSPPGELSQEQADEWHHVVNRLPADWFPRETHSMLIQYCRHVVAARRVAQLIDAHEKSDPLDIDIYDRILKLQERESRAICALARGMRITQQATYDRKKAKPTQAPRPWER